MDPAPRRKRSGNIEAVDDNLGEKMCMVKRFEEDMKRHIISLREIEPKGESDVQKMYQDAVVFVTGGTGFVGKQLVEKLLRACPGIKRIYLLSRSKKGKCLQQRLDELLDEPVFDELRSRNPDFWKLIVPIEGDVSSMRLGIKDQDWALLTEEVDFIFHAAATIRFDEPLKQAIHTNVRGTRELVALAQSCKNLRCLIYVSTAYSHCNRTNIEEKFYKCPADPDVIIDMVDTLDEGRLDALTPGLIKGWPNTYTFSKALSEEVVRRMCQGMPVCIIRPTAVICAFQEPAPGWVDINNVHYGPTGNFLASGLGVIRVSWVDTNSHPHFVPVDYVNNLTIVASWDTVTRHAEGDRDLKIYTLSRHRNPETWTQFVERVKFIRQKMMSPKAQLWYAHNTGVSNIYVYWIYVFFLHWIPSLIADPLLALVGSKIRLSPIHEKSRRTGKATSFFTFTEWIHHDDNTLQLHKKMAPQDREIFRFNISEIDPQDLVKVWCVGSRRFIIKDGLENSEWGQKKQWWLHKLHIVVSILYAWVVFKVFLLLLYVLDACLDDFISYFPDRCVKNI